MTVSKQREIESRLMLYLAAQGTPEKVRYWLLERPHFTDSPHVYDAKASEFVNCSTRSDFKVCRYCLRQINFDQVS